MRQVAEDSSPLSEPVFLILASLAREPRHGYALLQDVAALSNGRVRLSTGTLYGALRRLLESGWLERFDTGDSSRDKQSYRLSETGLEAFRQESARLNELSRIGAAHLRLREVR